MRWLQYLVLLGLLSIGYFVLQDILGVTLKEDARKALSFLGAVGTLWYLRRWLDDDDGPAKPSGPCLEDLERELAQRPKTDWPAAERP